MKYLQKNLMAGLLTLAVLFICGGCVKKETPEGPETPGGPETEDPKYEAPQTRFVSSVEAIMSEGDETYSMAYDFKYDNLDRLTDIIVFYEGNEQAHAMFILRDNKVRIMMMTIVWSGISIPEVWLMLRLPIPVKNIKQSIIMVQTVC